jgi:polysaccharide biosynthesis/export protein
MRHVIVSFAALFVSACGGGSLANAGLPQGAAAYTAMAPSVAQQQAAPDYRIGALDTLSVSVFQEPDLSTPANAPLQVNANGNITMPLIGTVPAAGKTTSELGAVIADRLGSQYLKSPQVNVAVTSSVSQKVTVQGEVTQPGVYQIQGKTTLLDALSMAKGETRVATLNQVAVFRVVNGQRMGAIFDVNAIRRGSAPDPEVLGNDTVVVGYSKGKGLWRDILASSPLLGLFRPF